MISRYSHGPECLRKESSIDSLHVTGKVSEEQHNCCVTPAKCTSIPKAKCSCGDSPPANPHTPRPQVFRDSNQPPVAKEQHQIFNNPEGYGIKMSYGEGAIERLRAVEALCFTAIEFELEPEDLREN